MISSSAQGVVDAEAFGRAGLHPAYAAFVSIGATLATQMLQILRSAAGQDDVPLTIEAGLRSAVEERWRAAAKAAGKAASVEDMRAVDPDLLEKESQLLGAALKRVLAALPEHSRALVVDHSPTNEAARAVVAVAPAGRGPGLLVEGDCFRPVRGVVRGSGAGAVRCASEARW